MNDNDERKRLIAEGAQKPGAEGAFWRLMQRMDVDEAVPRWVAGERIRGTTREELLRALAEVLGAAAVQGIGVFGRHGVDTASRELMVMMSSYLEERIAEMKAPPKPTIRLV